MALMEQFYVALFGRPARKKKQRSGVATKWARASRLQRQRFLAEAGAFNAKELSRKGWNSLPGWLKASLESQVLGE